jgi:hypothetical protein
MLKVILKTFLGLSISALGFGFGYLYLTKIEESYSLLFLLPAAILVIFGIYILFRAGKSEETVIKKPDMPLNSKEGLEEVFNKNNQLSSRWAKTVENRDKLKLLQISTNAQEQE